MKDVPTDLPEGLHLSAITKREDPRDAFIAGKGIKSFNALPQGANIGTSSLRRICQLLNLRPDLKITQLRGNVDTRLRKVAEGEFDAIILATAGVKRLGFADRITEKLSIEVSLPAIGQGAVGIECKVDDEFINSLLKKLNHEETAVCVRAERAFLKKLEGGCQVPIAAYAKLIDGRLIIEGLVGSLDGKILIKEKSEGAPEKAESLGTALAEKLLAKGAREILDEVYG
jgi:hydroxymethylbilane synthase